MSVNTPDKSHWTRAYLESLNKKLEQSRRKEKPEDSRRQEQVKNEDKKTNKLSKTEKKKNPPVLMPSPVKSSTDQKKKQESPNPKNSKHPDPISKVPKVRTFGGTISRIEGDIYWVNSGHQLFPCKARFNKLNVKELYIGDHVHAVADSEKSGWIEKVDARQNLVANPIQKGETAETIAAVNVNQIFLVISVKEPVLRTDWLDRHLIVYERRGFKPVICCSKIDLAEDNQFMETLHWYAKIGYKIIYVSSLIPSSIFELKPMLKNKKTFLTGHNGVGKTTIRRMLVQPPERKINLDKELNEYAPEEDYIHTEFTQAFNLDTGGMIIDSPGIQDYDIGPIPKKDLKKYFREFRSLNNQCSVSNCLHIDEPFCAVRNAVAENMISQERYDCYLKLLENLI